jgi:hypothetical protein
LIKRLLLSFFFMSSRIPSCLVRRFDYRVSFPLLLSRRQWETMLELAEINHWDPFPVPGFSFRMYRYSVLAPLDPPRPFNVDYDDFVLDFAVVFEGPQPENGQLIFLSDGILLADDFAPYSLLIAYWVLGPTPNLGIDLSIVCFTIPLNAIPGDMVFQRMVVPTRYNSSAFRLLFPTAVPATMDRPFANSFVNRFVVNGEPVPMP